MDYESKNSFSSFEKMVIAASLPLGNHKYNRIKRSHKDALLTVEEICSKANISIDKMNALAKSRIKRQVSGIYRAGSRFIKDCICVQLYEDGDGIMRWAAEHGATVCVTRRDLKDIPCIIVDDPAAVYADMCSIYRNRSGIEATTIVGSIGKTTTKKMVEAVYSAQYETFCDAGNDNQIDGVGFIAQHIPKDAEKWVQEVSEDTPGCIRQISKIVKPAINIVTAIDKSHIQEYGDEEGILDEIRSIDIGMTNDSVIITSKDAENTRTLFRNRDKVVFVSTEDDEADFYAKNIRIENSGMSFVIVDRGNVGEFNVFLPNVYAKHNAYSALYAFAAGVYAGVSYDNIVKGLLSYKATGIRQNVYHAKGMTVYADCYNAVAKSVRSAAEACDAVPVSGKRIAVIGDVEEAGTFSEAVHQEIVEIIDKSKFDILLTYGEKMAAAVKTTSHRDDLEVRSFLDRKELNCAIKQNLTRDGLVLFKASHKSRLEKSIATVFPFAFLKNNIAYYWPQVTWRIKVTNSWTL